MRGLPSIFDVAVLKDVAVSSLYYISYWQIICLRGLYFVFPTFHYTSFVLMKWWYPPWPLVSASLLVRQRHDTWTWTSIKPFYPHEPACLILQNATIGSPGEWKIHLQEKSKSKCTQSKKKITKWIHEMPQNPQTNTKMLCCWVLEVILIK